MSQAKTRSRDRRRDKRPENFLPLLPEYGLFPAHRSGWDGRAMPLPRNFLYAPVAQGIEHRIPNPGAAGSIPAWSTNNFNGVTGFAVAPFSLDFCPHSTWLCCLAFDLEPASGLQLSVEYARKRGSAAIARAGRHGAMTPGPACDLPPRKAAPAIPEITMTTRLSCRRAAWVSRDAPFMFFSSFRFSGTLSQAAGLRNGRALVQ